MRASLHARPPKEMVGDNATVTSTDIAFSTGVIHVIDSVVLPKESDVIQLRCHARVAGRL